MEMDSGQLSFQQNQPKVSILTITTLLLAVLDIIFTVYTNIKKLYEGTYDASRVLHESWLTGKPPKEVGAPEFWCPNFRTVKA